MSRRTRNATQRAGAEARRSNSVPKERSGRSTPSRMTPEKRESHGFISVWVDKAWWAPSTGLLEILFNDQVRALYEGVSRAEWEAFKKAGSAGQYVRDVLEKHPYRVR